MPRIHILSSDLPEEQETIVFRKFNTSKIHESIFSNIFAQMDWRTLSNMKIVHHFTYDIITRHHIISKMIDEMGAFDAFCQCVYDCQTQYMLEMLETFHDQIETQWYVYAIMYCIYTHRNDIVQVLIEHIPFQPNYSKNLSKRCNIEQFNCTCGALECMKRCIGWESDYHDDLLKVNTWMMACCVADNKMILQYLLERYPVSIDDNHLLWALTYANRGVLFFILKAQPDLKLGLRKMKMLIDAIMLTCRMGYDWDILDYVCKNGHARLTNTLLEHMLFAVPYSQICMCDFDAMLKLINRYASKKTLQKCFNNLLHLSIQMCMYEEFVTRFLTQSPKIEISDRHIRMAEQCHNVYFDMKYILLNKMRMQSKRT